MGSSAKKKHEKKKDFKKPKLKVGKARPKPTNFTDTSFKAKSVVLAHQSLSSIAPSPSLQFSHHVSLLTLRSSSQRRDSLAYLTTAIRSRPVDTPLPQPLSVLLPKLCPLILDESNGVRAQLSQILGALPSRDIEPHISQILVYIRAALTHLAADIRSSGADLLLWAIGTCANETVSCAGGWVKTLRCILTLLHWHTPKMPHDSKGASTQKGTWTSSKVVTLGRIGSEGKIPIKALNVLASFLRAGLCQTISSEEKDYQSAWLFPLHDVECHMMPRRSNAYAHLNLFGPQRDEETEMYAEREARQRLFHRDFRFTIDTGVQMAKRDGGEVGRAAAGVKKALAEGMEGFEPDE